MDFGVTVHSRDSASYLPPELPDFAFVVTAFWALISAGLLTTTLVTAATIRHRRTSHRFPVSLEVRYSVAATELPLIPATAHDLNTYGLKLTTSKPLDPNSAITLHVQLDDEQAVIPGTVVRGSTQTHSYGVAFDPLPATTRDLIARWCFRHPFGPDLDLHPTAPHKHHDETAENISAAA